MSLQRVLFIDRDGTLVVEPEDQQVDALEKIRLVPGVMAAMATLRDAGYRFVMVSNQDGLGTASFPEADFERCQEHIVELFASQGLTFDEIFICPHFEQDGCDCRKPRTGLLTRYLAGNSFDLRQSAVIGDRVTDLELAERIGIAGFKLGDGCDWEDIVTSLLASDRVATVERGTTETRIRVSVNLDATGRTKVASGIGFFDHMLEQISKHGGFRLELRCDGDLHIDEHHTVEDTAICLGSALREALGDKRGIGRYGFVLPMDESQAQVAIDLSGRGAFRFDGDFERDAVGGLSIEMVRHFFDSLADSMGAAIHIRVEGDNAHHMVEACFKAVGRALRQAISLADDELPTTKGLLA